jgi:tRNA(Ile)-lysidine synthase TilS/MesJ
MKIKLKYLNPLRQELNGLSDQNTGQVFYKGLLLQNLHFKQKYHLTKLAKELDTEFEQLQQSQKELLKKHFGDEQPVDSFEFRQSEEFKNFEKEITEFFEEEVNFSDLQFSIDDFDFKSSESYPVFMELFVK